MNKITATILAILMTTCICAKDFTVVIDAGHGGKDPGAIGRHIQEKEINLKVALLVGNAIKKDYPGVKVVYTRSTDVYVTLPGRAQIANKANGDLFISIHTNATESKSAYGTETFMLGLAKTNANFEVAKRENSVMLLEDDKEVYQGFDPTSPDSYIMFELMQDRYIDLSIQLAGSVQSEFTQAGRSDRGVRQAGFWVLHQVKMPSVLVELGFISNTNEETFLGSDDGQKKLADCIVRAFGKYKHEYDKRSSTSSTTKPKTESTPQTEAKKEDPAVKKEPAQAKQEPAATKKEEPAAKKEEATPAAETGTIYMIQCFSGSQKVGNENAEYRKASQFGKVTIEQHGKIYRYMCGEETTEEAANALLKKVQTVFKSAFIVKKTK